jgi:dienelactone hydrolase
MRRARLLVVAAMLVWSRAAMGEDVREDPESIVALPDALEIVTPGADVPAAVARFHGAWFGVWVDIIRHVLIVERVAADGRAQVVYAIADSAFAHAYRSWLRLDARIEGETLIAAAPGAAITYRLEDPDRLVGSYETRAGQLTMASMRRIDVARLAGGTARLAFPWPGERVTIPHLTARTADATRPIRLEATLYRPLRQEAAGSTPAPLAIINHGSDIGRDLLMSFSYFREAHWLLERGYAVMVLMRRGRGQSEGTYGEDNYIYDRRGWVTDCTQGLAEAVADLDSAIAYGASLDFVRPGPVLLLGQSRGGLLAVHYAGLHPERVRGVINFVGGWMGGQAAALNTPLFAAAGAAAGERVPQLWLYGERDSFYPEAHIRANLAAFEQGGGRARFEFARGVPGDGHRLMNFPARWRPAADAFLATLATP